MSMITREELMDLCKRQIEDKHPQFGHMLDRIISVHQDIIIDEDEFYNNIATYLIDNIFPFYIEGEISDEAYGLGYEMDGASFGRLLYLTKLIDEKKLNESGIKEVIKMIGPKNMRELNNLLIQMSYNNDYRKLVFDYLTNNILDYFNNIPLINYFLYSGNINESLIDKLLTMACDEEKEIFKLKRNVDSDDGRITTKETIIMKIMCFITLALTRVESNKKIVINNTIFKKLLDLYQYTFFKQSVSDEDEISLLSYVLEACDISKLDLVGAARDINKYDRMRQTFSYLLYMVIDKMEKEDLVKIPGILNNIVKGIFSECIFDEDIKKYYDFFGKLVKNDGLCLLHPYNALAIYETLYKGHKDKKEILNQKAKEMLENNNTENKDFYEELLISLLKSIYYCIYYDDSLVIRIIKEKDINLNYEDNHIYNGGSEGILFTIAKNGSKEVKKALVEKHEEKIPFYFGNTEGQAKDKCSLLIETDKFNKAIEVFNNSNFCLFAEKDEKELTENGQLDLQYEEHYVYSDTLTEIMKALTNNPDLNTMDKILYSPRIKFISCDLLSSVYSFYKKCLASKEFEDKMNSVRDYFKQKISNKEVKVIKIVEDDDDAFITAEVRLATTEEIEESLNDLIPQKVNVY